MPAAGDRDNFDGNITVTAPTGGYTKGLVYQLGSGAFAVALQTVLAGASCAMALQGPVWVSKTAATGKTMAVGSKAYFVTATKKVDPASTGNTLMAATVLGNPIGTTAPATSALVLINLEGVAT